MEPIHSSHSLLTVECEDMIENVAKPAALVTLSEDSQQQNQQIQELPKKQGEEPLQGQQQQQLPVDDKVQDEEEQEKNPRKRHGARNQHRHKFFVKWLMERFDLSDTMKNEVDMGSRQRHVLDIAGGKGEVAARLCMCHCQKVVMVDPRPADIVHCFTSLVLPKIPKKWQQRLLDQQGQDEEFITKTLHQRFQQFITTFDSDTVSSSLELHQAIQDASLLVGLHADGATEAIVDVALQFQKPFVVVPCCVFPNLFTTRKILSHDTTTPGTWISVRSHEQFCQYLLAKDPRLQREILPFEGRNVAIWWNGK